MRFRRLLAWVALAACARAAAFSPPAWSLNQPIYEVNLEMFSSAGTYQELEKRLPELKALGVGILWLMPIMTRGVDKAFGSPYCVKDFRGLHAPYGSSQDLKNLIHAVHHEGMHIILDWVGNHSSWDNPLIFQHPEFYEKDKHGKISAAQDSGGHVWADVAQLDYGNPRLRQYMIGAMNFWVKNYDIDGFRCDVAWRIPIDFWIAARGEIEKTKPVFMLAETSDPDSQRAFDSDYNFELMNSGKQNYMTDLAHGIQSAALISKMQQKTSRRYAVPFMRMNFTTNHDDWKDNGTSSQRLGAALKAMGVLTVTLPGKPLIYNGQEIGWDHQEGPIEWTNDTRARSFRNFYSRLFHEYQGNPALYAGDWHAISSDQDSKICAYLRIAAKEKVLVILNLSAEELKFKLDDPELQGLYTDLFNGHEAQLGVELRGDLPPWGYRVLHGKSDRLPKAELSLSAPLRAVAECEHAGKGTFYPVNGLAMGLSLNASAGFQTSWDSENLYVTVSVSKATVVHDAGNDVPWNDDSVEIYLDMKHDRATDYQAHDFQYIVGYDNPRLFEKNGRTTGVKFSSHRLKYGYDVDIAIPWSVLGVQPLSGALYGFDIGVNLGLGKGVRGGSLMWNGDDQNFHNTELFGDLLLAGASK